MGKVSNWLWGATLGAAAMYFYDPNNGRRRRALVQDQLKGIQNNASESLDEAYRDLQNRFMGVQAELTGRMSRETPDDRILEERIRSRLGTLTHHPGSIEVHVSNGHATLVGDALTYEVDALVSGVSKVRGIKGVDNQLNVFETADNIPGLQGIEASERKMREAARNWSPGIRLLAGVGGGTMALTGGIRRGLTGRLMSLGGWALVLRSLTNKPLAQMVGMSDEANVIDIQRSFRIPAPIEKVYDFWSNFENFPRFMSHIQEVKKLDNKRSHWVATGPAGVPVEWDAIVTENRKNEVIGWESTADSQVKTNGNVRFTRVSDEDTQVDVHLNYNPPAGVLGHAVAAFFGVDPQSAMAEDMQRVKSLLTEGKTTVKGEEVRLEDKNKEEKKQ